MDSYGIRKQVDKLGRITIPKAFRNVLGMSSGSDVVICQVDEGILIKPYVVEENKDED